MSMYKRTATKAAKAVHSNVTFGKTAARAKLVAGTESKTRVGAAALRKGVSRMARYTRYSAFSVPPDKSEFKLRATLRDRIRRQLQEKNRIFPYQRVWIIGKNIMSSKRARKDKDFFKKKFEPKLDLILEHCAKVALSNDIITGLLLYMGEWSILMVECTEDMVGEFLIRMATYASKLWTDNRIFYVEDNITETYFEDFIIRRAAAMNLNQNFSPATPNDPHLMVIQHFKMIEKVSAICKRLRKSILKEMRAMHVSFKVQKAPRTALSTEYNKLLPEVQRLEVFMNCTKFYRTLDEYTKIYYSMDMDKDEDMDAWPMLFHLTPSNVFTRSPYEANLTFADYQFAGKSEKKLERPSYAHGEDDEVNENNEDDE